MNNQELILVYYIGIKRKRELARALLTRSIQIFQEMGFNETALGVDTENPS